MAARTTPEQKRLGVAIRQHRELLGVSQEDFAELAGFHRTYIGQLERGEKNLSFHNLLSISGALKLKASALLSEADF